MEHFFRHEYGKLVATLSRRVGVSELTAIEDAVQWSLMTALEAWTRGTVPDDPSAWLYRVAHNRVVGDLRKRGGRHRLLKLQAEAHDEPATDASEARFDGEVSDDLLRMLFVCCDEAIPEESRLVLALKTLCGFGVREISVRLFITEANVYKRLARARERLRQVDAFDQELSREQLAPRLPSVRKVLYLLFTEGYLSSHAAHTIRQELCDDALRLATLLGEHTVGNDAETFALVALMHLHRARMNGRQDGSGGLLLLEEQDRGLWEQEGIATGLSWLARSARGECFSRYHAEAGIAAEHCLAPSFGDTRWDRVAECYALLERVAPSPLHRLNRAVAIAELNGPAAGLAIVEAMRPPSWLQGSYMWSAVLADLYRRAGDTTAAKQFREVALNTAPTPAIRALLERRLRVA